MNNIEVLYEDDSVVVINKPAGLIVHSDGRTEEPSVSDWVLGTYPETKEVGEPWTSPQGEIILRPGIVHRLDRTTSGVMVIAKTNEAHAFLKEQFQNRTTEKIYNAFVYGHPKENEGVIEAEIVRIKSKPPRWGVKKKDETKKHREAVTQWSVIQKGEVDGEKVSFMELSPKTGRTHQLRVHLKHLGNPIICDHLYAKTKQCILGFERPALHARRLSIEVPGIGGKVFEAPLPDDFEKALNLVS